MNGFERVVGDRTPDLIEQEPASKLQRFEGAFSSWKSQRTNKELLQRVVSLGLEAVDEVTSYSVDFDQAAQNLSKALFHLQGFCPDVDIVTKIVPVQTKVLDLLSKQGAVDLERFERTSQLFFWIWKQTSILGFLWHAVSVAEKGIHCSGISPRYYQKLVTKYITLYQHDNSLVNFHERALAHLTVASQLEGTYREHLDIALLCGKVWELHGSLSDNLIEKTVTYADGVLMMVEQPTARDYKDVASLCAKLYHSNPSLLSARLRAEELYTRCIELCELAALQGTVDKDVLELSAECYVGLLKLNPTDEALLKKAADHTTKFLKTVGSEATAEQAYVAASLYQRLWRLNQDPIDLKRAIGIMRIWHRHPKRNHSRNDYLVIAWYLLKKSTLVSELFPLLYEQACKTFKRACDVGFAHLSEEEKTMFDELKDLPIEFYTSICSGSTSSDSSCVCTGGIPEKTTALEEIDLFDPKVIEQLYSNPE